ncbi:MAG TPA: hypothetical protein VG871_00355 [Vicinamibacterales bacterium]|nr:hypothetical protein [Vicinamibacterales bacterium]
MRDIKTTVDVIGGAAWACSCGEGLDTTNSRGVADAINHYIEEHGYQLLHVGTQTVRSGDGQIWHNTIAVLGHTE